MVRSWKITALSGRCLVCQALLPGGDRFVSALYREHQQFERRDFCLDCFAGYCQESGEPFSFWQGRTPPEATGDAELEVVPRDTLLEIFKNAVPRASSPEARQTVFVLGMVLLRRKALKAAANNADGLEVVGPDGDEYLLSDPGLAEAELLATLQTLEGSLGCRLLPA